MLNRQNYARNLSYHYVGMCNLDERDSCMCKYLKEGGFTASLTGNVYSKIPVNQIIEIRIN